MSAINLQKVGSDFNVVAIHKKTGEKKKVNIICLASKEFNSPEDVDRWHNFSKRGEYDLYLEPILK